MDVMYPHAIDRLRVVHFLLRAWRYDIRHSKTERVRGCTQAQLARKAKFKNKNGDIISDLESLRHLADVALRGKRAVARETLLKVLNSGLNRSHKDMDAVLWLYEGESFKPLQKGEVKDPAIPIPRANQYENGTELRSHIGGLLKNALRVLIPNPVKKDAKVEMIFELNESAGLESDQALRRIEREDGQRLVVTKYPSYLTYPPDIYDYSQWRGSYEQLSDEGKQNRRAITDERRQIFLEHLQDFGERSIHSKESLRRYLQASYKHRLSYDERVEHVKHWIKLLETHEKYEIGLAKAEPEFELAIKNTIGAFLSGPPGDIHSQQRQNREHSVHFGPRYVQLRDEKSIFAFFVDFEQKWAAIPEKSRNKTKVISWLRKQLPNPTKHSCS